MFHRFDPYDSDLANRPGYRSRRFMAADVYKEGDAFVLEIDAPGVGEEAIDIEIEKKTLTITVDRPYQSSEDRTELARGRAFGSFTRRFFLTDGLDADGIRAAYDNGVLTISIPVLETALARKVEIGTVLNAIES